MGDAVSEVAAMVRAAGGRALLVGGCVRDFLCGRESKDSDLEVFGLEPGKLKAVLSERFGLDEVGASFGVVKLHGVDIDVALPRRETKLGLGHRAFGVECDPFLPLREAAARRDFTVNAIYRDPLTGEVLDPWGGCEDLRRGVLRHVSDHFGEDPLRVLRGMQFVARFDLTAAPETVAVCRTMTPENLPRERLFDEWRKLLLLGRRISRGLEFLRDTGWLRHYPELAALVGCRQDPQWHPEGDVWNHTLCCLDAFAAQKAEAGGPPSFDDLVVGFAVLCHDFGKPATTAYDPVKKRMRALGHDTAGAAPALSFMRRLTAEERLLKAVPPLVRLHMRPYAMWRSKSGENAIRRLAAEVGRIDLLLRVCAADDAGRPPHPREPAALDWLAGEAARLAVKDSAPKPLLLGRDLLAAGMRPGPGVGAMLKEAYDAQIDGVFRDRAGALAWMEARREVPRRPAAAAPLTYIIWDWNGTLLDDTRSAFDTLNIMLARRGAPPIKMDFYLDHFAFPVRPFYEAIGMVLENEDWDALAREYHDLYHAQRTQRLNPEALAAVAEAARSVAGQSILSALRQDLLERDTAAYGIRDRMEQVAGVDNLDGASKLARGRELLDSLRTAHPEVRRFVMIGDALHDKDVADALGIDCVLCGQGSHAAWRLAKVAPTGRTLLDALRLALAPPSGAPVPASSAGRRDRATGA